MWVGNEWLLQIRFALICNTKQVWMLGYEFGWWDIFNELWWRIKPTSLHDHNTKVQDYSIFHGSRGVCNIPYKSYNIYW